jgi:CheY-like chemotaxis protein
MSSTAKRKRRASSSPPASGIQGIQGKTPPLALVVDDSCETRELHVQCLSLSGWRVASAGDGKECLTLARDLLPDIILIEMEIPGIDGWEVTRSLKADARTREIAVIAMANRLDVAFREAAAEAGCAGAVTKDCSPEELLAQASAAVGER